MHHFCMALMAVYRKLFEHRNVSLLQNNQVWQKIYQRETLNWHALVSLTQPIVTLILIMLPPATAEVFEDHSYVAKDDERRRKDRTLMEGHDQLVPLELPHLVGDGLHFKECVTVRMKNNISSIQHCFTGLSFRRHVHILLAGYVMMRAYNFWNSICP